MPKCVVKWCRNTSQWHKNDCGITFHMIPSKNLQIRKKWIDAIRLERNEKDWLPGHQKVCSIHFSDDDFYTSSKGNRMLLSNTAVPICTMVKNHNAAEKLCLNVFEPIRQDAPSTMQLQVFLPEVSKVSEEPSAIRDMNKSPTASLSSMSSSVGSVLDTPIISKLQKNLEACKAQLFLKNQKMKSLQNQNKRLIIKNTTLKKELAILKKENRTSKSLLQALSKHIELGL